MKNRHLIISVLMLALLVSVLFYSCGILGPEDFITMERLGMSYKTSGSDIILNFSISEYDDEYDMIQDQSGPSLLLCYALAKDAPTEDSGIDATNRSYLVTALKTAVDTNKNPVFKNEAFASYNGIGLYPFLLNDSGDYPNRPRYNFCLSKILTYKNDSDFFIKVSNMALHFSQNTEKLTAEEQKGYYYNLSYKGEESSAKTLKLQTINNLNEYNRIYIFGVISPGFGDFKYFTWSKAFYLGSIPIITN